MRKLTILATCAALFVASSQAQDETLIGDCHSYDYNQTSARSATCATATPALLAANETETSARFLASADEAVLQDEAAARSATNVGETNRGDAFAVSFEPIVITAPAVSAPTAVSLDPKKPQQPLPANDGASFLKSIPGMSVIRKGGTDGDLVFRGAAASRLNILLDGAQILGGCGGRMDPPTAYIFPESYDRVTLIKGPQSVIYGMGASAGTALFERKLGGFDKEGGGKATLALTAASFDRLDRFLDVRAGNESFYAQGVFSAAKSGDYKDGDGKKVHSRYERESVSAALGWTPSKNTALEISGVKSEAEAAYADRGMDGSAFDRENYAIKFESSEIGDVLYAIKAQAYHNYIDHVMDNYSLRSGAAMAMASNPDRKTEGGRLEFTFALGEDASLITGADAAINLHRSRSGSPKGAMSNAYDENDYAKNALFKDYGLFGELTRQFGASDTLIVGARADAWDAEDKRETGATAGKERTETLFGGFVRYEGGFLDDGVWYAGFGRSERAPDFWEAINKQSEKTTSAFDRIETEKTNQIDIGLTYKSDRLQTFVSAFYNKIDDYILIDSGYVKAGSAVTVARNVKATTFGGEAGADYRFGDSLKASLSLAYTRGENDSDNLPLGQIPPFESRFGLDWDNGEWSLGALWRFVDAQNRYALKHGNIVGQDLGGSKAFNVVSINGGYRWGKTAQIAIGVDNLLDKTYAEFISKSGANVEGYEQTTRVNEPGRVIWFQARIALN